MKGNKAIFKRIAAVNLCVALAVSLLSAPGRIEYPSVVEAAETVVADTSEALPFHERTADEMVEAMGNGWNLGNTFDGHTSMQPAETLWQNDVTTPELITAVHDAGFNSIRIPVTWGNMIEEETDSAGTTTYSINEQWISRVQDVVDYAIAEGMYVVINMHHDAAYNGEDGDHGYLGWLHLDDVDPDDPTNATRVKFAGMWSAIATYFKNYDEHLIYESMNEVTSQYDTQESMKRVNALNQDFVDAVRATGGNNTERWLSVPGVYTNIPNTTDEKMGFELPEDRTECGQSHIFVAVHEYPTINSVKTAEAFRNEMQLLVDAFTSKGIPVILGEYGYGCRVKETNTEADKADKEAQRAYNHEITVRLSKAAGVVAMVWDNNSEYYTTGTSDAFKLFNRDTATVKYPDMMSAILRGFDSNDTELSIADVYFPSGASPTVVTQVTDIQVSKEAVTLTIGDSEKVTASATPQDSNDPLVWSSDDTSVATVYNGKIDAVGVGTTTIHVKSDSGSASKDVTVTVTADKSGSACTSISCSEPGEMESGESFRLNAQNATEGSDAWLTYRSSDKSVVTVSKTGKVVAVGGGSAVITIASSSGYSKDILVTVSGGNAAGGVYLAAYAYFISGYSGNLIGEKIFVNDNGTYTVSFDCDRDLPQEAIEAGVSNLNDGIGAIYIMDFSEKRNFQECNIYYNNIVVDGTELTITNPGPKSALKSKVFNTNDPINGYDGSVVEGVSAKNNVISFDGIDNPKKISITFTLSDMWFEGADAPVPTVEPAVEPEATPTVVPEVTPAAEPPVPSVEDSLNEPTEITKSGSKYIINVDKGTAIYSSPSKTTLTKITIPATIKQDGKTYKVTSIQKNAFKNNKKLKTATIGVNIKQIGANAFSGCAKLQKITIKSKKLTKVGNNALKGIYKKATIKVPKTKLKNYTKLLKGKGQGNKVKIK